VAITRAKKKLILVGAEKYLNMVKPFDKIIDKLNKEKWDC
jgi:superfamily I DNA and/or RNA helicase